MQKIASLYTNPRIGVLGSHSALEIMDGAKDEEFETIVFCQKGRQTPYQRFNRISDQIKIVNKFKDMANSANQKLLRDMADFLRKEKDNCIVVLGSVINNRPALVTALSESLISKGFDASLIVRKTAHYIDGGGGGKKDIAQAGGKNANSLPKAIDKVPEIIQNILEN